jgi:hypothetical protein
VATQNENARAARPPHKLAFWVGLGLGITGLLIVAGTHMSIASVVEGTTLSQAFGLILLAAAFVMFGIAWHLAGKHLGEGSP